MLHHTSLGALNIERAARFYDAALEPLGYVRVWSDLRPGEQGQAVGYGPVGSGGTCNGPPGLRPEYGSNYFAAFVVDPERHRLEAVCKAAG